MDALDTHPDSIPWMRFCRFCGKIFIVVNSFFMYGIFGQFAAAKALNKF